MRTRSNRNGRSRRLRTACRTALPLVCGLTVSAAAADKSWDTGAGVWNVAGNWTPAGVPLSADAVFIGNHAAASNADVTANTPVRGASLTISDGMRLVSDSASVVISGPVLVTGENIVGTTHYPSSLLLDAVDGSSLAATGVQVLDGGILRLRNDCYASCSGLMRIDAESELSGTGTLTLNGGGPRVLINDGLLDPTVDGMVISQIGAGLLDLDGDSGNGDISLSSWNLITDDADDLTVHGTALHDAYDGKISMLMGATLDMDLDSGWTLGVNGELQSYTYDPRPAPARILGSPFTLAGRLWVNGFAQAILDIEAVTTIQPTASVDVAEDGLLRFEAETLVDGGEWTVGDDAKIEFHADTTMNGGTFEFPGLSPTTGNVRFHGPTEWDGNVAFEVAASQYNTATVTGTTVIDAGVFDMDGSGSTVWNIGAPFVINADRLEAGANNAFEGEMNIGGGWLGGLTIHLAEDPQHWIMANEMNLTGDLTLFVTRVSGSPMTVLGDLTVTSGKVQIAADTILANSAVVNLAAASTTLRFNGSTIVQPSATFTGVGTIHNGLAGSMRLDDGVSLDQVGVVNGGTLLVAAGAGVASVDRFQNSANGKLSVSIGGYGAGSDHDLLIVSGGTTQLDGVLNVSLIDVGGGVFEPLIGDEFTILTSLGAVGGAFAGNPRSFSQGQRFDWTVLYGSNDVTLRLDQISDCPDGDLNDDGDIDLSDLAILLANFGTASGASWPTGDLDGDGAVSLQDLAILLANFGATCS